MGEAPVEAGSPAGNDKKSKGKSRGNGSWTFVVPTHSTKCVERMGHPRRLEPGRLIPVHAIRGILGAGAAKVLGVVEASFERSAEFPDGTTFSPAKAGAGARESFGHGDFSFANSNKKYFPYCFSAWYCGWVRKIAQKSVPTNEVKDADREPCYDCCACFEVP